jgi:hypothetical protein
MIKHPYRSAKPRVTVRFVRHITHPKTGERIYPKTAKAFPIKFNEDDKAQMTFAM